MYRTQKDLIASQVIYFDTYMVPYILVKKIRKVVTLEIERALQLQSGYV
jgi:hypothetical protein